MDEEKKNQPSEEDGAHDPSEYLAPATSESPAPSKTPAAPAAKSGLDPKSKKALVWSLVAIGVVIGLMSTFLAVGFTEAKEKNTGSENADAGLLEQGFYDAEGKRISKGGSMDFAYDSATTSFTLKSIGVLSDSAVTLLLPYAWMNEESANLAYYVSGSQDCEMNSNLFAHEAKETQISAIYAERYYSKVGAYAFSGLLSLKSFKMANTSLSGAASAFGDYAFAKNPLLAKVTLPNVLSSLGKGIFSECPLLTSLTYGGTKSDWSSKVTLGENWRDATLTSVVCSDGTLSL
jgi:hypothetical protein